MMKYAKWHFIKLFSLCAEPFSQNELQIFLTKTLYRWRKDSVFSKRSRNCGRWYVWKYLTFCETWEVNIRKLDNMKKDNCFCTRIWIMSSKHTVSLLLFNLVPEEQLTEFVESKDHMIILKVFKEFPEKEEVIVPALYSLHSLAGPCKCITGSYFEFLTSYSVHQLTSVCSNLSVIIKNQWELVGSCQTNHFLFSLGNTDL